jgi:pilus assembly protein CpaF
MVNGPDVVYIEKDGMKTRVECRIDEASLLQIAQFIARLVTGSDISEEKPILDARLQDGSRLAVVLAPTAVGGTVLTIRKFRMEHFDLDELVRTGMLSEGQSRNLSEAVDEHSNILIAGGGGTGKTTLLNALADKIDINERICLIEDTAELQLGERNLIRFEERTAQDGLPEITSRDLLKAALRHQPDRILVGEVRGDEAWELLQAMNTGHDGTISTIHATTANGALTRLADCMLGVTQLPLEVLLSRIAASVDYVVHLMRDKETGYRQVTEMVTVDGFKDGEIKTYGGAI